MDKLRAQQIMANLAMGGMHELNYVEYVNERYYGKVYSKGRPRFSGNHAFTPENTRKFEADVTDWLEGLGVGGILCPVAVKIILYDRIPKTARAADKLLMKAGLVTSTVGDLDNRAKSILDAMNGTLLEDDKQVAKLSIDRKYDYDEGFRLVVSRAGYSVVELDMLRAAYNVRPNKRRS